MNRTRSMAMGLLALTLTPAIGTSQTTSSGPKIATVHLQNALLGTKAGQVASRELRAKAEQKEEELKKLQDDISNRREQLRKSGAVALPEKQDALSREIDRLTKAYTRRYEDYQTEMEQEQGRVLNDLGNRMVGVIQKYGARAGYTLILDISSPQTPVLYNSNGTDVTPEVVRMFDEVSSPKPDAAPPRPTK